MVNPILILASALGAAFMLSLFHKRGAAAALTLLYLTLGFMACVSLSWFVVLLQGAAVPEVFTAGFRPPLSISLRFALEESFLTALVNLTALAGALLLGKKFRQEIHLAMVLYLMMIVGFNGIIMTRDIFNFFVFMEISSIATYGMVALDRTDKSLAGGFKAMVAGGLASAFLLLGILYVYRLTGSLNLDALIEERSLLANGIGTAAMLMILMAVLIELKLFPLNGWALDLYESVHGGVTALLASAGTGAMLYSFYRFLPLMDDKLLVLAVWTGLVSFFASHIMGLMQTKARRLLGYSSFAQAGLIAAVLGMGELYGSLFPRDLTLLIAGGLFLTNFLAKAVLFWIASVVEVDDLKGWGILRRRWILLAAFGASLFALAGLPPFPAFTAKWELITTLFTGGRGILGALILLGSLLEGVYLFRWFGYTIKNKVSGAELPESRGIIPAGAAAVLAAAGVYLLWSRFSGPLVFLPLALALVLLLLDRLPSVLKNVLTLLGLGGYAALLLPTLTGLPLIFALMFLGGPLIILLASFASHGRREGFYPFVILMAGGMAGLTAAATLLEFFYAWELMTLGSYILILRGKESREHALSFMVFSLGGAYLLLMGFARLQVLAGGASSMAALAALSGASWLTVALLSGGFLTKTAAAGLHIWLPGAHAEAETDVSPLVSAVLLKAGVFGLMLVFGAGRLGAGTGQTAYILGWLAALTAVIGNLLSAFEEDAKRLLAYSSIGQLGYIVFGVAINTPLGWLMAMAFTINHFFFKSLLFLAVGGVVKRTGTRQMYQMGGLITAMPLSFIAVLIGIIALSGVPPLSGFAGKWLLYNAILEKGWYFQGLLAAFAGIVAFLYCFRLIFTIFLGQRKDNHRTLKEAPAALLIPQFIFLGLIMTFSMKPGLFLKPAQAAIAGVFGREALVWNGSAVTSIFGYWNGPIIMVITGVVFVLVAGLVFSRAYRYQRVKQFNIVFAAEAPERPETTHYGYNFFAPYRKALWPLLAPLATGFWAAVTRDFHWAGDVLRRFYTGNGQTYAVHILVFFALSFLLTRGGF